MAKKYQRIISFENILNFRDLGGYLTRDGHTTAWRRLFRSGALLQMTSRDKAKLIDELGIRTVIDLRSPEVQEKQQEINLLNDAGIEYRNISFRPDNHNYFKEEMELYQKFSNIGEVYLHRIRHKSFGKRFVESLEAIAMQKNYPLIFHCGAGKDRTGILAAVILEILGVPDKDIIDDYSLTEPFMEEIRRRWFSTPDIPEDIKNLPDFTWRATPDYMSLFLRLLRNEYGSAKGYLETMGAESPLVERIKKILLV
jgi:protein-tyrosine phosphatase